MRIRTQPLWRLRVARELGRYLLYGLALAGILASVRFAIAPPRPRVQASPPATVPDSDMGAQAFAALFARRYLTWSAAEPLAGARALEPFTGAALEAGAGLRLPATGEQRVEWLEVVQSREPLAGEHVYTIAAQTDTAGLLYLTVSVQRQSDGTLTLADYPALVGPPAYAGAQAHAPLREVSDGELQTVVERALRNYLAGSEANLDADLSAGAQVSPPKLGLSLLSLSRLRWAPGAGAVLALVQAQDQRGVRYSLDYELDVARVAGRWEIAAIQTDPQS